MNNRKGKTTPERFRTAQLATVVASLLIIGGMPGVALGQQQAQAQPGAQTGPQSAQQSAQQATERPNDFPTLARVEYVIGCLNETEGPRHEMMYKCVCAADRVAEAIPYERWVEMSTIVQAQPIAGERGAYIRERKDVQSHLKHFRELQLKAKKSCFIPTDAK